MSPQDIILTEAQKLGFRIFRNNSGACVDQEGRTIRYGLGNVSKQVCKYTKSSDWIGFCSKTGRIVSWEQKPPRFKFRPKDEHQLAQANWLLMVHKAGGDARFVTPEGYLMAPTFGVFVGW